jgi:hypothetical protein
VRVSSHPAQASREDLLPQTPYALLAGPPINRAQVEDVVLWSVRRDVAASNLSVGSGVLVIFSSPLT